VRRESAVTSAIAIVPPARTTRAISAIARGLSGNVDNEHSESATSKPAPRSGSVSASPTGSSRASRSAVVPLPQATATMRWPGATPARLCETQGEPLPAPVQLAIVQPDHFVALVELRAAGPQLAIGQQAGHAIVRAARSARICLR
jgi:hypothetical protein